MSDITRREAMDYMNIVFIELNTMERLLSNRSLSETEPDLGGIIELVKQFIANRDKNYETVVESLSEEGFYEYYNKICELAAVLLLLMPFIGGGITEEAAITEEAKSYLRKSLNQFIKGHYTEDVTLLGTAGQVAAGFVGADLPMDIRDLYHDFTNWEWTWEHAGKTALDGIGLIPLIGVVKNLGKAGDLIKGASKGNKGILTNANYAQKTYGNTFSIEGVRKYSELADTPINTIDDLVNAIRSGKVNPSDVTVEYIVRDGNTLLLNTRTSQALTQVGIPREQWVLINRTGDELFEGLLTAQLKRNKLGSEGTPTVRASGGK